MCGRCFWACCSPFILPLSVFSSLDLTFDGDHLTAEYLSPVLLQSHKGPVGHFSYRKWINTEKVGHHKSLSFYFLQKVIKLTCFLNVIHFAEVCEENWVSSSSSAPIDAFVWDINEVLQSVRINCYFTRIWYLSEPIICPASRALNRAGQCHRAPHWNSCPVCCYSRRGSECCLI